jgi:hypothetical protein
MRAKVAKRAFLLFAFRLQSRVFAEEATFTNPVGRLPNLMNDFAFDDSLLIRATD